MVDCLGSILDSSSDEPLLSECEWSSSDEKRPNDFSVPGVPGVPGVLGPWPPFFLPPGGQGRVGKCQLRAPSLLVDSRGKLVLSMKKSTHSNSRTMVVGLCHTPLPLALPLPLRRRVCLEGGDLDRLGPYGLAWGREGLVGSGVLGG